MEYIRYQVEGGHGVVVVDRPKALNALNAQTLAELSSAIATAGADGSLRALIVMGSGDRAFVAGADITEMKALLPSAAMAMAFRGHQVMDALAALPFPTIACVNGFCLGGGLELALACDFIYASETAVFGFPEVTLGIIPGFGGTQRLARLVGVNRAKELIFSGNRVSAAEAKAMGLVLEVYPPAELVAKCKAMAATIALRGAVAVRQAKRAIDRGADASLEVGNELERQAFAQLFSTADQKEGVEAFLSKRAPTFIGA